ncbi:Rpn family recombination-promoting nuclease/putative transposase [Parabacteroides sp. AF18-52]|jgi:conserved hypothetical protein (putative transposase or invertase)|uniref:Rpn family recombination-promoting nuclease/putative transposase n=1 Tax=Parabacteroides TaxID=375288 RepID=UPI000F00CB09|nr:Rpn family recombination-promoting nuclease/putative transposase [Parabacteroides sp. AF18-52]RHR37983.1 Rpn family recombination-promoting nuclease/putative transposase [Parabacteroides sp. AF18-52]
MRELDPKAMAENERQELQDRYIRFDWAVKRLLRQKANFGVLEGFLTVMLREEVKILEILESEGNRESADDKFNRVDIKAKNSKGEIIIVEIQNTREVHYLERILYGVAKAITEHISLGEGYQNVKKVYSISILYFDLGVGTDYIYHGQNHFTGVHTGDRLRINTRDRDAVITRLPAEIFPEYILVRVNEFDKIAMTPLDEWIEYLKDGTIRPDTTAPGLREAREKLKYYSMSAVERHAYDEHLNAIMIQNDVLDTAKWEGRIEGLAEGEAKGKIEGLAEGKAEGLAEGKAEALRQAATNMKRMGMAVANIAGCTGLSAEEIEKL